MKKYFLFFAFLATALMAEWLLSNRCFATSEGIVLLNADGHSESDLEKCPNTQTISSLILSLKKSTVLAYTATTHFSTTIANADITNVVCSGKTESQCIKAAEDCYWYTYPDTEPACYNKNVIVEIPCPNGQGRVIGINGETICLDDIIGEGTGCRPILKCSNIDSDCKCTACQTGYHLSIDNTSCIADENSPSTNYPANITALVKNTDRCTE